MHAGALIRQKRGWAFTWGCRGAVVWREGEHREVAPSGRSAHLILAYCSWFSPSSFLKASLTRSIVSFLLIINMSSGTSTCFTLRWTFTQLTGVAVSKQAGNAASSQLMRRSAGMILFKVAGIDAYVKSGTSPWGIIPPMQTAVWLNSGQIKYICIFAQIYWLWLYQNSQHDSNIWQNLHISKLRPLLRFNSWSFPNFLDFCTQVIQSFWSSHFLARSHDFHMILMGTHTYTGYA